MKLTLYHGTTTRDLAATLRYGLRPRGRRASNWAKNPSRADMVYLTSAYPFYYAMTARDEPAKVVFEVDAGELDPERMHPDEDFVVHVAELRRGQPLTADQKRHACDDLDLFRDLWRKSLAALGNCAYRGTVPAAAITRYCLFDSGARPDLAFHCFDASITLLNYRHQGRQFEEVVAWFFGDRTALPMVDEAETDEERAFWHAQSKDRSGIEVVVLEQKTGRRG